MEVRGGVEREETSSSNILIKDTVPATGARAQSCLTLCGPTGCSPPGSSVHGILQMRTLE